MKELTKEQRHEIYKEALYRIELNKNGLMCYAINEALQVLHPELEWEDGDVLPSNHPFCVFDTPSAYPEFFKFKPSGKENSDAWFLHGDKEPRIEILTKCIEETR